MSIQQWLTPHWAWLLLGYPAWQAANACPLLWVCGAVTAALMAVVAATLALARELALVSAWQPPD